MRRLIIGLVPVLASLSLAACGSSGHGTHLSDRERILEACGDLRARIEGIGDRAGIRDPQPATLRGSGTARRLVTATKEALSSFSESSRTLERLRAPRGALAAVSEGVERYEAFARRIAVDRPSSVDANLKLETDFTSIGLRAGVGCLRAA